mmetsp:Transcript_30097/g.82675  ORF Transcript_30097/g.82675 Transcript_30097/m.82675 type:complete len:210 (-) Transcript_30097:163-792(-)
MSWKDNIGRCVHDARVVSHQKLRRRRHDNGKHERHGHDIGIEFQFVHDNHAGARHAGALFLVRQFAMILHIHFGRDIGKGKTRGPNHLVHPKDGLERHVDVQFLSSHLRGGQITRRSVGRNAVGFGQTLDGRWFFKGKGSHALRATEGTNRRRSAGLVDQGIVFAAAAEIAGASSAAQGDRVLMDIIAEQTAAFVVPIHFSFFLLYVTS